MVKIIKSEYYDKFLKNKILNLNKNKGKIIKYSNISFSNYNYNHLIRKPEIDKPSNETLITFLNNNIVEKITNNITGIFFYSLSSLHHNIQHLWFDYIEQLNQYYELLISNPDYIIIFEFVPINPINSFDLNKYNKGINNLNKFINFLRDININNEYKILQPDDNKIELLNLFVVHYKKNKYNYLPLISRNALNVNRTDIKNTLIEQFSKYKNKNKYFILEKRIGPRKIPDNIFNKIKQICLKYCNENNFKFIIWDISIAELPIIKQIKYTINAEYIVGFGGSFWLFNIFNTANKLILNVDTEDINNDIITQIMYYTYNFDEKTKLYFNKFNYKSDDLINILNLFLLNKLEFYTLNNNYLEYITN